MTDSIPSETGFAALKRMTLTAAQKDRLFISRDDLTALVECAEALKVVAPALNTARLIMDKESRDYVGELLNTAGAALAKLEKLK